MIERKKEMKTKNKRKKELFRRKEGTGSALFNTMKEKNE